MSEATNQHPVPAVGDYRIEPADSRIEFATRHVFGLLKVTGSVAMARGIIHVQDPLDKSTVYAVAEPGTIHTRNPVRDRRLRGRMFLDANRHSEMVFRSESLREVNGSWRLSGTLSVKNVEAPLELTIVEVLSTGGNLNVTATGAVDRFQHGIRAMPGMAARRLQLTLSVAAKALPPTGTSVAESASDSIMD
jgi:polyisoprenoid-binding protein YceI